MAVDSIMLEKTSDTDREILQCSDCGCSFSSPQLNIATESTTSSVPPQHQEAGSSSKCPSCRASCALPSDRLLEKSNRLKPHNCSVCGKSFITSAHLNLHMSSHNKEKKFKCNTCGKFFYQASHLIAHEVIHSGNRPFKCPECGKCFVRASHLKTHRRLHTGEKPYKCSYCCKAFTQKSGLLSHVRQHTGDHLFKCEQCGETFPSLHILLAHKAQESSAQERSVPVPATTPTPVSDPTPAAVPTPAPPVPASAQASTLNEPEKAESGLDDLKCGVCCRTFVRSSYIRLCIRLSKGQRPYHCKVCNKTFVKMETFVNHCDKHLRQKKDHKADQDKVVKPPQFVPLFKPPSPESLHTLSASADVNTRSKTKTKIKTEP